MIGIGSHEIEIDCPRCRFYNPIYLKQIIYRDVIICRGCKSNLKLDDYSNEVRKVKQQISNIFKDLKNLF